MNSAIAVLSILCLSISITNCETSLTQHHQDGVSHTENHQEDRKVVNIDIKNDGGGLKISLPTGEIYVPSERKNVHIKTIDVFEEKSPLSQPDSDFEKYEDPPNEDEGSSEEISNMRSKMKSMYNPQPQQNPQPMYYMQMPPGNQFPQNPLPYPYPPVFAYLSPYNQPPPTKYQENDSFDWRKMFGKGENGPDWSKLFGLQKEKVAKKEEIVQTEDGDSRLAVLGNCFVQIVKSVVKFLAQFFVIDLPPFVYQVINYLAKYLIVA